MAKIGISHMFQNKSWVLAAVHALVMVLCVFVILGALYTQMQPYKYTSSNMAFEHALHMDDAAQIRDFEDVWDWLGDVVGDIGGRTSGHVESNCAYNEPNTQFITVENKTYEIFNPLTQYGACQNMQFIEGAKDPVFLTGDNELMLFGMFSLRSADHLSMKRSVGDLRRHRVRKVAPEPVDPSRDRKVIEVCTAPWDDTNVCVKKDGFFLPGFYDNSPGSALHWPGKTEDGKYVFQAETAWGSLHRAGQQFEDLLPCYSSTSDVPLQWGKDDYTDEDVFLTELRNCDFVWTTSGFDTRKLCLDAINDQPTPQDAYVASRNGFSSIIDMIDYYNGCNDILEASSAELENMFTEGYGVFRTHLSHDKSWGTFFNTTNQGIWLADHTELKHSQQFHGVLDHSTRLFTIYIVTRNLGDDALFYTLLRIIFTHKTDGTIRVKLKPTYIPIIQYYYALDGYPFIPTGLFFFEILVLVIFACLAVRETLQLRDYFLSRGDKNKTPADVDVDSNGKIMKKPIMPRPNRVSSVRVEPIQEDHISANEVSAMTNVTVGAIVDTDKTDVEVGRGNLAPLDIVQEIHDLATDHPGEEIERVDVSPKHRSMRRNLTFSERIVAKIEEIKIPDNNSWGNLLDYSSLIILSVAVVYRILYIERCRSFQNYVTQFETDFERHFDKIIAHELDISRIEYALRIVALALLAVALLQFFRYISFDRRLGMVSATLYNSLHDLGPVMLVFVTVFSAYAVIGSQMYGQQLVEFETFTDSLTSLLLMVLGEYGVLDGMKKIHPLETKLFFWTFIVLVLFLLLNMVLAIVLTVHDDHYKSIKKWEEEGMHGSKADGKELKKEQ